VVEFVADGQQPGTVVGAGNDAVANQFAAEDLDLGFEEADAGVAARGATFSEDAQSSVESAGHKGYIAPPGL
jgi:hypothetical protein